MSGLFVESEWEPVDASSSAPGTRFWRPARPPIVVVSDEPSPDEPISPDEILPDDDAVTSHGLVLGMRLPGSRLRILEHINDGGCGVVFRGEHIDLQRPVAIKVQRAERLSGREMFLDEARATTRIESPHVVQVVDFGELEDGRVWYAMELLGGRSLDELIAGQGRMDTGRVIALLRMACKGLAAAHAAGLVHRDVKPQNLVVVERGGREHLVLVDFGIAVPIGSTPPTLCGTPEYMAGEQILGGVLDARTDVYALACCAYELLTGRSVVDGCTIPEALAQHGSGLTPTFTCTPVVPMALQLLVRQCLSVEPSERIASMVELEAALCEAQIAARIPNSRDDLELPAVAGPRRERIAAGFASLGRASGRRGGRWLVSAAVAASALGAFAIWPRASASPEEPGVSPVVMASAGVPMIAATPESTEPVEAEVEDASTESPLAATPIVAPLPVVAPEVVAVRATTPTSERAPPPSPRRVAHDAVREGRRALRRGDYLAAEDAFSRALQTDARSVDAIAGLSDLNFERGNHARAVYYARRAVGLEPKSAAHRLRLGDSYYRLERHAEARAQYLVADRMGSARAEARLQAMARSGR